jgi:hypothetical protein
VVRKKRERNEEKKKKELESKDNRELSEGANIKWRKEMKAAEEQRKKVMSDQATEARKANAKKKKQEEGERKKEERRRNKELQDEVGTAPSEDRETIQTVKTKKPRRVEEKKGKRKVPEAGDVHGCKHSGLLGLIAMPKNYLRMYVKEGGWLYKSPCKDCATKENGTGEENLVLDVASLLSLKGTQEVGYYCNCGPTGYGMEDGHEYKAAWSCDMVLCMSCYNERTKKMSRDGGAKRSRRRNTRLD